MPHHWLFPIHEPQSDLQPARLNLIRQQLAPYLAQIFGYNSLLYTRLASTLCEADICIKNQLIIDKEGRDLSLKCKFEELPIASDCIDLAVLPAVLQATEFPHQVLREVERVLIPEGVIIVIGRNPFSWQGLKNRMSRWQTKSDSLHHDISRSRISDWFRLLGLQQEIEINLSVTNQRLQNSQTSVWIKQIGQTFCDWFCSYYIIIGRKKVSTLTPIRPSWRSNKQLVSSRLAEPSVRSQVEDWFEQLK